MAKVILQAILDLPMKYLDEYRDHRIARTLASEITQRTTKPWVLMEICGGQTHTIMRYGLDELLPRSIEIVHGPGCPVCVTPLETVDKSIALALRPEVILVSYGDMLRVPGSRSDLFRAKAQGADVRIAYSPTEAVKIARANPQRKVVFLAIGFENNRTGERDGGVASSARRADQFFYAGFTCAGPARDSCIDGFKREPRAGVHRTRACLHRDGMQGV